MSKHKYTTAFCIAIVIITLVTAIAFITSSRWGVEIVHSQPAYAEKLFDTSQVHTIDIVVKDSDWEGMLANAQAEEYIQCSVVIDGESVKGVGIRPKGNSSLSMVASSDSDRYSFKIEFDQYEKGKSYFGLDKLALNNIAQDNTYMKDYVTYQMMNEMEADAPLSSFIWVTVNGEDWGLYLAAEGVEESFAQRVYGNDFGEIYKPDSMDMGDMRRDNNGERGVGRVTAQAIQRPDFEVGEMPDFENGQMPNIGGGFGGMGGGFGGMGGGTTSLLYSDDNIESYAAIFDNAAFKPSEADKKRLIASLKQLNEGVNIEEVVDVDEVIRYFVVHNFVLNSDSYTGNLTHNYYLAENDGKLSMIAWDYNLAFGGMGGFGMGGGMGRMPGDDNANVEQITTGAAVDNATQMVNYPIDSPMLSGSTDSKPMIAWIFNNEEYLTQYHEVFAEYMDYFDSGKFTEMYDNAIALISPYAEKDPSAFTTYEDFQKGSTALREFCLLRAESIKGQLNGTIAATSEGQTASGNVGFIDASSIDIQSMGSNSMGFNRARGEQNQRQNQGNGENTEAPSAALPGSENQAPAMPGGEGNFKPPEGQGRNPNDGNMALPNGENPGNNGGRMPPNMDISSNGASATPYLSTNEAILLLACAVVLLGGILFAKKKWR